MKEVEKYVNKFELQLDLFHILLILFSYLS